jgi:hypothetical protein
LTGTTSKVDSFAPEPTADSNGRRSLRTYSAFLRRALWAGRRIALQSTFDAFQAIGIHVTPNHFYDPIPDTKQLAPSIWDVPTSLPGVDLNEQGQLDLLESVVTPFKPEYSTFPLHRTRGHDGYYVFNGNFETVDGEVLYALIRHFKPQRIVEVGSGASTLLALKATRLNKREGNGCELTTIDPFPPESLHHNSTGPIRLIDKPVQAIDLSLFQSLRAGDILFIDSTHVARIGSDVVHEILRLLPELNSGVLVHFHDIFLPSDYPRRWVVDLKRFWNEQYLLQAFLCMNPRFEVVWGSSFMHLMHPDRLADAFPSYDSSKCWPASFWIQKLEGG